MSSWEERMAWLQEHPEPETLGLEDYNGVLGECGSAGRCVFASRLWYCAFLDVGLPAKRVSVWLFQPSKVTICHAFSVAGGKLPCG